MGLRGAPTVKADLANHRVRSCRVRSYTSYTQRHTSAMTQPKRADRSLCKTAGPTLGPGNLNLQATGKIQQQQQQEKFTRTGHTGSHTVNYNSWATLPSHWNNNNNGVPRACATTVAACACGLPAPPLWCYGSVGMHVPFSGGGAVGYVYWSGPVQYVYSM